MYKYTLYMFVLEREGRHTQWSLADSKDFESKKILRERTYWKGNRCFSIERQN
jgi:hypothetical protein